jgi:hypothetical protein
VSASGNLAVPETNRSQLANKSERAMPDGSGGEAGIGVEGICRL